MKMLSSLSSLGLINAELVEKKIKNVNMIQSGIRSGKSVKSPHFANIYKFTDGTGQLNKQENNNCPGPYGALVFENMSEQFNRWMRILRIDFQRILVDVSGLVVSRKVLSRM